MCFSWRIKVVKAVLKTEERQVTTVKDAKSKFRRRSQATGDVLMYLSGETAKGGRLLELPAGDGLTTQELVALGYDVVPADLFPDSYQFSSPKCVKADMLKPLPFEDESFDYIVCQEGVEHIESPLSFTRECARVLRSGGKLILTTPNVLHLSARLAYFLVGHRTTRRGLINEHQTFFGHDGDDFYHGHAWHWRYFLLRYILRLSGFKVHPPLCGKCSWFSVLFSIPVYPLLWLAHRSAIRSGLAKERRREVVPRARETYKELRRHALSRAILWGKRLILVAEKEDHPFIDTNTTCP